MLRLILSNLLRCALITAILMGCSGGSGGGGDPVDSDDPVEPGTASLSWTPPTTNTDGSTLEDLAGYKIYFGTTSGDYSDSITVDDNTIDSYVVDDLAEATWYFAVSAFDSSGNESEKSNEASKVVSTQ